MFFRLSNTMPLHFLGLPSLLSLFAFGLSPAQAMLLVQVDGVLRTEFAEVLHAEPVYSVPDDTDTGHNCAAVTSVAGQPQRTDGALREMVFAANAACSSGPMESTANPPRPIAWDVDYILRGIKYRSRLPYDPGNRLRVHVSITPVMADDPEQP